MKNKLFTLACIVAGSSFMAFSFGPSVDPMDANGGPAGYAGDPSGGAKTCGSGGGCHTGAPVGTIAGVITSNIPPAGYIAGSTYTITANFIRPGHSRFGFQVTPQNATGTLLGSMAILSAQTKLVGSSKYITHTATGNSGTGSKTWNFRWTAPATGMGPVTFYGVFNAANNDNQSSGDSIFKSTMVVNENTTSVFEPSDLISNVSIYPNPTSGPMHVSTSMIADTDLSLELYNFNGDHIRSLYKGHVTSGDLMIASDLTDLTSGVYFIKIIDKESVQLRRIVKL